MDHSRRTMMQAGAGAGLYAALIAVGLLEPGVASAAEFDRAAFEKQGIADTLKALGAADATQSAEVVITSPTHLEAALAGRTGTHLVAD